MVAKIIGVVKFNFTLKYIEIRRVSLIGARVEAHTSLFAMALWVVKVRVIYLSLYFHTFLSGLAWFGGHTQLYSEFAFNSVLKSHSVWGTKGSAGDLTGQWLAGQTP